MQAVLRSTLASNTFYHGKVFLSSADSSKASCQLLMKECKLCSGKLPRGGLPRNRVVK